MTLEIAVSLKIPGKVDDFQNSDDARAPSATRDGPGGKAQDGSDTRYGSDVRDGDGDGIRNSNGVEDGESSRDIGGDGDEGIMMMPLFDIETSIVTFSASASSFLIVAIFLWSLRLLSSCNTPCVRSRSYMDRVATGNERLTI